MARTRRQYRLRFLKRHGERCYLCGKPLNLDNMTVDHVVPVAAGGRVQPYNRKPSCRQCNLIKGDLVPLYVDPSRLCQVAG